MPDLETAVENITVYDAELAKSAGNIDLLADEVRDVRNDVQIIERAISKIEEFRDEVSAFNDDLDKLDLIFRLMDKASALRPFAEVGDRIVDQVQRVITRFEDKLDDVVTKIENNPIRNALVTADTNLGKVESALGRVSAEINAQKDAFAGIVEIAAKIAVVTPAAVQAVGDLVAVPRALVEGINDVFDDEDDSDLDSVKEFIDNFDNRTPDGEFNGFIRVEFELSKVLGLLDDIRSPLNAVYNVLKPIEPLLKAADFVASITVDPVIDFVTNTLGVDKLINAAAGKVDALLPSLTSLDQLEGVLDSVLAALDAAQGGYDFNTISNYDFDDPSAGGENDADPFGIGEFIFDQLQAKLLQTVVDGVATKIGTVSAAGGPAIEIPEGVRGADDDDILLGSYTPENGTVPINISNLIMIGDRKDNLIRATGGNNALYGAEGNDTLEGGTGTDTAVFSGPLSQYTFSRENDDPATPVIIEHISPIPGVSLDGLDTLINIDQVTFLGGANQGPLTFTIEDLFGTIHNAPAGTLQDFSAEPDSVFIFATGTSATVTELSGGSGDDQITGTTGSDSVSGNGGDDDLRSEGGEDTIDGGAGIDTFTYFGSTERSQAIRVDLASSVYASGSPDVNFRSSNDVNVKLIDVENIAISGLQPVYMFGDDNDNSLTSAGARKDSAPGFPAATSGDLIDGRGGDDVLRGGAGEDVLIGGAGIDSLYGGVDDDVLVVADLAVAGGDQFYDGGEGHDGLYYSGDLGGTGSTNEERPLDRRDFLENNVNFILPRARDQAEASGPVRILGDGRVERLSMDGTTVLATDTAINIESYTGSEFNDTLIGTDDTGSLRGAGGDDVIFGNGASGIVEGGDGADTVHAGTGGGSYFGGESDTLYLNYLPDEDAPIVRWYLQDTGSGGNKRLQAFDARDQQDISSNTSFTKFAQGKIDGFGTVIGSDFDDEFDVTRDGNGVYTYRGGGGNDDIQVGVTGTGTSSGQSYAIFGDEGDDKLSIQYDGTVDGGVGEDEIYILAGLNVETVAMGGAGNDFVFVQRANSVLDGGEDDDGENSDLDFIASHRIAFYDVDIDLLNGTMTSIGSDRITATLTNFEGAIGGDGQNDIISGDADGNVLIGGSGNDLLEGRNGNAANPTGNSVLEMNLPSAIDFGNSWTVEAEITTDVVDPGIQRIITKPVENGRQTFSLAIVNGEAHIRFDKEPSGSVSLQAGFVADGEPHTIAGRYDEVAESLTLFVDGLEVDKSINPDLSPRDGNLDVIYVGSYDPITPQNFEGEIAAVRAWDVARNDAQIGQPFSAITDPASEPGLQLSLSYPEDHDALPTDESANAFAVTEVGPVSGDDLLYGGDGNDSLFGGDGDDLLHGGQGRDTLDGGTGVDTASYALASPGTDRAAPEVSAHSDIGVEVDLAAGFGGVLGTTASFDTLIRIENVTGSVHADKIFGDNRANALNGAGGNDTLDGRGGDDSFVIQGDDSIFGGNGNDYFSLGAGNATINGGNGQDTLQIDDTDGTLFYNRQSGQYEATFLVDVPVWADTNTNEARLDGSTSFTPQQVLETDPAFATSSTPQNEPQDPALAIVFVQELQSFSGVISNIEEFIGGTEIGMPATSGNDILNGDNQNDTLDGLAGDDTLTGNDGDDHLSGSAGNDVLVGNLGRDTLDGGADIDTASYLSSGALVVANLNNGAAVGGDAEGDTLIDIENLTGSAFADRLTGDAFANVLIGAGESDLLAGLDGNDLLEGGTGADGLAGGNGDDTLRGDDDDDRLFGNNDNDLIEGGAGDDFTNGGNGNDTIYGGANDDNVLVGGSGEDFISGDGGNDGMNGSFGHDTMEGGLGDDRLFGGSGNDSMMGGEENDTLGGQGDNDFMSGGLGNDGLNGGGGNDTINGDGGEDRLFGGSGADVLNGGTQNDLLIGQGGIDTFVFDVNWGHDQISGYGDIGTGLARVDEVIDLSSLGVNFSEITIEATDSFGTLIYITADGAANNSIEVLFRPTTQVTESDFFFG